MSTSKKYINNKVTIYEKICNQIIDGKIIRKKLMNNLSVLVLKIF